MKHKIFKHYKTRKKGGQHYHLNYSSRPIHKLLNGRPIYVGREHILSKRKMRSEPSNLIKSYPDILNIQKKTGAKIIFVPETALEEELESGHEHGFPAELTAGIYNPAKREIRVYLDEITKSSKPEEWLEHIGKVGQKRIQGQTVVHPRNQFLLAKTTFHELKHADQKPLTDKELSKYIDVSHDKLPREIEANTFASKTIKESYPKIDEEIAKSFRQVIK